MPKTLPLPPLERLNELFEVVPIAESQFGKHSGLMRKVSRGGRAKAGSIAGTLKKSGLRRIEWMVGVDRRRYSVSRIIYFMLNNNEPGELEVDHKDRNPLNNNAYNLRLGDDSLQTHNQSKKSSNTSGAVGVFWNKPNKKWTAQLRNERKPNYLGLFICKIDAARVYNDKVIELGLDQIGKPLNDLKAIACGCGVCQGISN